MRVVEYIDQEAIAMPKLTTDQVSHLAHLADYLDLSYRQLQTFAKRAWRVQISRSGIYYALQRERIRQDKFSRYNRI